MRDKTDPASWVAHKTTPDQADRLAERDRECRKRHGVPLFVKRTGPPPSIEDLMAADLNDPGTVSR